MQVVTDKRSDEELVAACNRGDGNEAAVAFGSLYEKHRDYVLRVAMRFTDDREIATDALQEVFSYLLKQFPPPGPGLELRAKLTTYLYPIAKNTTLTLLKKARRLEASDIDPDELAGPRSQTDSAGDIDRLLANLSFERREVLTLRFVDGLSLDEIAATLEIPLGTVKSRLHNAIKALRDDPGAREFFEA